MKKWPVILIVAGLFLSGCTQSKEPAGNKPEDTKKAQTQVVSAPTSPTPEDFGDMLIDGSIGDASNLVPFLASDSASISVEGAIYSSLLRLDKDMNSIPDMAESWEVSKDQKTITFHLRKNIKWQDGTPFTSQDLMFQYQMMIHPDTASAYKDDFLQIDQASTPDDYTFTVTYKEPYAPALVRVGGMTGLPRHLLKDVKPADLIKSSLARKPVGTGPYKLADWKSQASITLLANPDYFGGKPMIAATMTRIIPDQATQFLELQSGGVDMMDLQPLQYLKQTDTDFFKTNYTKYKYLSSGYTYLGYNMLRPMFQDKRVRQAITYAIDKKEIIEGALLGLGQPTEQPFKPGTWAYNENIKKHEHDPEKAKQLLAEAGWKDSNGDGVLDKDGAPFEFEIITNQGNSVRAKTAEIIQQRLKKVGITVKIRVIEWSSFLSNFVDKHDFDAVLLGWQLGVDPDQYAIWHSSKIGPHEMNHISYKNPEVDELLEKARRTFDKEERKKYYYRFSDILAEDQPYTFLFAPEATPIVSKRVRGIVPGPAGIGYNSDKWWIPKAEHKRQTQLVP